MYRTFVEGYGSATPSWALVFIREIRNADIKLTEIGLDRFYDFYSRNFLQNVENMMTDELKYSNSCT